MYKVYGDNMNNKERRQNGLAYIADSDAYNEMLLCRKKLQKINLGDWCDINEISKAIEDLFGKSDGVIVNPPFYCDYGTNIEVGKNFCANYNCTILDVAKVKIGVNCMLAPNVSIFTAGHPVHPFARNSGYEYGKPITIGDNVWIGGNSVICPGVKIGNNVVIGAGSVVTKDIPDWCIAAGNPCKFKKTITENDRRKLFKDEDIDDEAWNMIMSTQ